MASTRKTPFPKPKQPPPGQVEPQVPLSTLERFNGKAFEGGIDGQTTRTFALRVPQVDWAKVVVGVKTEFRRTGYHAFEVDLPIVVVGYYYNKTTKKTITSLLVLEECFTEVLGAISQASIAAEGFDTLREFIAYWRGRYRDGYRGMAEVTVYRLRPFVPEDRDFFAYRIFDHLYADYL